MKSSSSVLLVLLLSISPLAQLVAADPESEKRLVDMKRRVEELDLRGTDAKFSLKPLLRFTDPTRRLEDASVWTLGEKGRPKAILVLEKYSNRRYPSYELTVTSNAPPSSISNDTFTWRPDRESIEWKTLRSSTPPSNRQRTRGMQMKQIARKFSVSEKFEGQTYQLRMLPKPLLRYEDEKANLVDGSIFVFSHGTNPELLLLVEAHQPNDDKLVWKAGFARLGGAEFTVNYKREVFQHIAQYLGRIKTYFHTGGGPLKSTTKFATSN